MNNKEEKHVSVAMNALSGDTSAGHNVSWANGTKQDAGEPRNEKALGPMLSVSRSLSESSAFST